ncbi:MAG TPA: division/cell wall cluster transcriptional repressor MraZ [Candidatus Manganitrophaceae bacterium]|nr:division/cell wall cluster transcriptional repressor MraZ [Candidatus Manganitrophaceae bacterium]
MFLGRFQHAIDSKGRLSIPVKFREVLNSHSNGTVIITTDFDRCLIAYPLKEWNLIAEKVKKLPMMDKGVKNFLRFFYSWASECLLDKQGRILIPPPLREYASLERDTMVIGVENKFEIWNPEKWGENETLVSENTGRIAETLAGLGL